MKNKHIALKAADLIEHNPQHFDMDTFASGDLELEGSEVKTTCGTVACIAGFVMLAYHGEVREAISGNFDTEAAEILGLDMEQSDSLFFEAISPEAEYFGDDDGRFASSKEYARAAANKLRRFVEENE